MMQMDERYRAFMSRGKEDDGDQLRLENYTATIESTDASKRPLLHELAMSVFWPHRARDIDMFLSLGQGYVAIDEIGRPLGSAMYFNMGEDFAMFGMMTTTPRLQAQGTGKRLLRRIMRDCEGRDLRLTTTMQTQRIYASAGFEPVCPISQQQGVVRAITEPAPVAGTTLRAMTQGDLDGLLALDRHAYGADRRVMLEALAAVSEGVVLEKGGAPVGFAMMRPFGKGVVIGPIVADSDEAAMQMTAPLIMRSEGRFVRVDTPEANEMFRAFLAAAGMGVYDTVIEMRLGPSRRSTSGAQIYGQASHSLG